MVPEFANYVVKKAMLYVREQLENLEGNEPFDYRVAAKLLELPMKQAIQEVIEQARKEAKVLADGEGEETPPPRRAVQAGGPASVVCERFVAPLRSPHVEFARR